MGPLNPGVDTPPGQHTLVSMTAEVYGAADDGALLIAELLGALSRQAMQLSHLLWRAAAVDNAVSTGRLACPDVLTCRQSAMLGVVVRVLPRWVLAPGTQSALPLPPPQCPGPDGGCLVVVALSADDTTFLWRALQHRLPPVWLLHPALAPGLRAQWQADLYAHQLGPDAVLLWEPGTSVEYWRL